MNRRKLGIRGEDLAAKYLSRLGYNIIARNIRLSSGEIDIFCRDENNNYVLVEVKTANIHSTVAAIENITPRKRAKLYKLWKEITKIFNTEQGYIMILTVNYIGDNQYEIETYILE